MSVGSSREIVSIRRIGICSGIGIRFCIALIARITSCGEGKKYRDQNCIPDFHLIVLSPFKGSFFPENLQA